MRGVKHGQSLYDSSKGEFDPDSLTGLYPEFGKEVQRICRVGTPHEISARAMGRKCHINNLTISNMRRGDKVEYAIVVKFAQATNSDINKLLRLSGNPELRLTETDLAESKGLLPEGYKAVYAPADADALDAQLRVRIEETVRRFPPGMQDEVRRKFYRDALEYVEVQAIRAERESASE